MAQVPADDGEGGAVRESNLASAFLFAIVCTASVGLMFRSFVGDFQSVGLATIALSIVFTAIRKDQ